MEVVNTVGRRKAAVARVFVKPGKGQITINRKSLEDYFPLEILQYEVKQPLMVTETMGSYDVTINLDGGGIKGQARTARSTSQVPVQQALIVSDQTFGKARYGFQIVTTTIYIICIT